MYKEKNKLVTNNNRINKGRDFVIGSFGWVIFHNIYFLLGVKASYNFDHVTLSVFFILPFVIGLLIPLLIKRKWIGFGAATSMFASFMIFFSFGRLYFGLPILSFISISRRYGFFLNGSIDDECKQGVSVSALSDGLLPTEN